MKRPKGWVRNPMTWAAAACCVLTARPQVEGGYGPVLVPETFKLEAPTAAFSPEDPGRKLGDFKAGIELHVVNPYPATPDRWLVEYRPFRRRPTRALIEVPDLSQGDPEGFAKLEAEHLSGFPVLKALLEASNPWPAGLSELGQIVYREHLGAALAIEEIPEEIKRAMRSRGLDPAKIMKERRERAEKYKDERTRIELKNEKKQSEVWEFTPLLTAVDTGRPGHPKVVIEIWNKGDAYQRKGFKAEWARDTILEHLRALETFFDTKSLGAEAARRRGLRKQNQLSHLSDEPETFALPNNIKVDLRYREGEFLIVEIEPYRVSGGADDNPKAVLRALQDRVKTNGEGFTYISGLPMIDQGKKGYCAAATIARVLLFYGYDTDMHACADLADTGAQNRGPQGGGTTLEGIRSTLVKVARRSPFRLDEIDPPFNPYAAFFGERNKRRRPAEKVQATLKEQVDRGVPILWLVRANGSPMPNHIRLLIGYGKKGVVCSDSYGPGYEFRSISWEQFFYENCGMFVLEPTP